MPLVVKFWRRLRKTRGCRLLFDTVTHLDRCDIMSYSKSIAWSAMFAIVPFLTLAALIGALVAPPLSVHGHASPASTDISNILQGVLPRSIAGMLTQQLDWLQKTGARTFLSVSIVAFVWTASSAYTATMNAINRIYGVQETRGFWRRRLIAVVLMCVQVVVAIGSVTAIVAWPLILHYLGLHGSNATIATVSDWLLVCVVTCISFGLLFRFAPAPAGRQGGWLPGSLFGAGIFLLLTYGFRIYVEFFANYQTLYGPVFSGILVLMIWIWLMSVVVLLAAELNRVFALRRRRTRKAQ